MGASFFYLTFFSIHVAFTNCNSYFCNVFNVATNINIYKLKK